LLGLSNAEKAGVALFVGAVQFGILLIVSESVSPTYSVSVNYISDLGHIFPASAQIFNPSIALLGILVIVTGYYLERAFYWKPLTVVIVIGGVGAVGVGAFPEGSPLMLHGIFSLITFLFTGLAAVLAARFQKAPLSSFSAALGLLTLVALVLYIPDSGNFGNTLGIGPGGLERLIVYPVLLWSLAFAGQLMATKDI
jgi:hypothetical membrane protein